MVLIRRLTLRRARDPKLTTYWQHLTKNKTFHTWIESSRNKLNAAAQNSLVSSYFDSNQPTFDFYEGLNQKKIILLNASDNFYQDRSSQSLLCSTMLFLAHQALLRRESLPQQARTPVVILCDEVSRYWVSDFIIPHLVLGRKYGGKFMCFSQSTGQIPPADLDIILSSVGHLVSFTVGNQDARRLAPDLFMPKDYDQVKTVSGTDLYGDWGDHSYYSVSEQTQHGIAELMNQGRQEMIWRIKKAQGAEVFLAEILTLSPATLARWRWDGSGPPFIKIGGRVRYAESDIETFIREGIRTSTSDRGEA